MSVARAVCAALKGDMDGGDACLIPGPGHSASDRSLSVKDAPDLTDGFVVNSFAGDDAIVCRDYVRQHAGLPSWKPASKKEPALPGIFHFYRKADGSDHLRVKRVERDGKKEFYQAHWNGSAYVNGAKGVEALPYRLPELVAAGVNETIFITEGEKDADRLETMALVATCNPMGAGKWRDALNKWFNGRIVANKILLNGQRSRWRWTQ